MCIALKLLMLLGVTALCSVKVEGFTNQPYRRVRLFSNAPLQSPTPFSARVNNTLVPPTLSPSRRESTQSNTPTSFENVEDDSDYDYEESEEFEDEFPTVPTQTSRPSHSDMDQQLRVMKSAHISLPTYANQHQNQGVPHIEDLRPIQNSQVPDTPNREQPPSFTSLFDLPAEAERGEWRTGFETPRRTVHTTPVPPTMTPTTMPPTTAATLSLQRGKTMILTPQQFASLFEQEEFKQNLHKYRVVKVAGSIEQDDKSALRTHQAPEITTARSLFNSPKERTYSSYDTQPAVDEVALNLQSNPLQRPETSFYTEAPVGQVERATEMNRPQRLRPDERRFNTESSLQRQAEQTRENSRPQKQRTDERRAYADSSSLRQTEQTRENSNPQKLRTDERRFYADPSPSRQAERITENTQPQKWRTEEQRFRSEPSLQRQFKQTVENSRTQKLRTGDRRVYTDSSVLRQVAESTESPKAQNSRKGERLYMETPVSLPIEVTKERNKVQLRRPVKEEKDEERSKVQLRRPIKQEKDDDSGTPANSDYQFSTFLDDGLKDSLQQRQEMKSGKEVTGMYSYSDGFFRHTVRYRADDTGYHVLREKHEPIGEGPLEDDEGVAKVHTSINGQEQSKYTVDGKELKGTRYASSLL